MKQALILMADQGYNAVGVQAVVDQAGVTKPTLYHYFGSKRGLLEAILEEYFEPIISDVEKAAAYTGDLSRNLDTLCKTYFRFAQARPAFFRMKLSMYFAPPQSEPYQAVRPLYHREYRVLEEMFLQATAHHGNMRGRHRRYAATFLGTIHNHVSLFLNGAVELNDETAYMAVHQFAHGIYS